MSIILLLLGTITCAGVIYFFCGMEEEDKKNRSNIGLITSLVIGIIFTLVWAFLLSLGKWVR